MAASWIVRHGAMRFLGEFDADGGDYVRGGEVVVRTERGLELGQSLCEATPRTVQMLAEPTHGRLVRVLTEQDRLERDRLEEAEARELETCNRFVAPAAVADGTGRRRAPLRRRADRLLLPGREARRFPRAGQGPGPRVPDAHRDAPDRRPRRGQAAGRLRRLRQAGLLQHAHGRHAAGVDADGQAAEIDARPVEDFRAAAAG